MTVSKLCQLDLMQAVSGLKSKKFSSRDLTLSCLDQISRYDSHIHAYLALNPGALQAADKSDKKYATGTSGPLEGIPIAVKDNFLTVGIPTTAASLLLESYYPPYESTVTQKLLQAGAIIIGKTNMDAWAHGSSTETSDYGPTHNPWNYDYLPGGSSGGSAAAVSSDMCIAAIGSETAGSIRQPAAWCGVTGFKPTYGRVSRYGVIAMASSTDSPGPLAKTSIDCAYITQLIAGADPKDATSSPIPVNIYDPNTLPQSLSGLKIGLAAEYMLPQMPLQGHKLILDALSVFASQKAKISQVSLINPKYSVGAYTLIQRSEVSSNLARYDGIRYGHNRSYFKEEAKRRIMLGTYALSSGYYDRYYRQAEKVRTQILSDFHKVFTKVDLLVGPTSPSTALALGASADQAMFGELQDILLEPSSISGLTSISIPCGQLQGLPFGLQIIGPQFREDLVFRAAHNYQQFTDWHHARPTLQ